jgi:hypothetical protein
MQSKHLRILQFWIYRQSKWDKWELSAWGGQRAQQWITRDTVSTAAAGIIWPANISPVPPTRTKYACDSVRHELGPDFYALIIP